MQEIQDVQSFKNEIKKELYKTGELAVFTRYISGNLYYSIKFKDKTYEFPISTVEKGTNELVLSADLGTTSFESTIKGSYLNRWISKAIDNNEFNQI